MGMIFLMRYPWVDIKESQFKINMVEGFCANLFTGGILY